MYTINQLRIIHSIIKCPKDKERKGHFTSPSLLSSSSSSSSSPSLSSATLTPSMGSMSNPNPWAPYNSYTDCSQGICNIYCPQWCYLIFPPPPPSFFQDDSSSSSSSSSPLLIVLIGILATAFILVSYYTLISKYCHRHLETSSYSYEAHNGFFTSSNSAAATGDGLNESVIKSITVYKYRNGDGFVDGSDCSVCLSEFEEKESLRLLPKCNHAFHLPCIDTWLKSHSNCPLCRASVTGINPTTTELDNRGGGTDYEHHQSSESVVVIADLEIGSPSQPPEEERGSKDDGGTKPIRRSVSLNAVTVVVSIGDVLREIEEDERDRGKTDALTAANERSGGVSSFVVRSSVAMKRSVSTGRFFFSSKKLPFT